MNSVISFAVFVLAVGIVTGAPQASDGETQLLTDVVKHVDPSPDGRRFVTPFNYKSVLLQKGTTGGKACWRCSAPCSNTICCDDGYPQCCIWIDLCGCCGF